MDRRREVTFAQGNGHRPRDIDLEESKPFRDAERSVEVKIAPEKSGCYISKCQGVFIIFAVILLVFLTAVAVFAFFQKPCELDEVVTPRIGAWNSLDENTRRKETITIETHSLRATVPPNLPWSGTRLPRHLTPSLYTLSLRVDLHKFIFSGSVGITVTCHARTRYVIMHSYDLELDHTEIEVRDQSTSTPLNQAQSFLVPENQFFVIELERELEKGRDYEISVGHFFGQLKDNLRGLYRSSYKDKNGHTR